MRRPSQILFFLLCFTFTLYSYVDRQSHLTALRLKLPEVAREIRQMREDAASLRYEIDRFESPEHLIVLARLPQFAHLRHPLLADIAKYREGLALNIPSEREKSPKETGISLFFGHRP